MLPHDLSFWLHDSKDGRRRVVSAVPLLSLYAGCDTNKIDLEEEAYTSFWYDQDFQAHVNKYSSVAGFDGSCWLPWLWFDIDRADDLEAAQQATRKLVSWLLDNTEMTPDDLLVFFSGSKGFHLGCPMPSDAQPALDFHKRSRGLAEAVATAAGVLPIDLAIYNKCQPFRLPNSKHATTGLYKGRLSVSELNGWSLEQIKQAARQPRPFKLVLPTGGHGGLLRVLWEKTAAVAPNTTHTPEADGQGNGRTKLNALTLDFIRQGATEGDRHRLLFSAAANLAEFGCSPELAEALLLDPARDCGLSSAEARRQTALGLKHGRKGADE